MSAWGFPAALLGLLLVAGGAWRDRRGARLCGAVLMLFALWDFAVSAWRSPSGDQAIRIDLPLLLPIALAAAIGGLISLCARPRPTTGEKDKDEDKTAPDDTDSD